MNESPNAAVAAFMKLALSILCENPHRRTGLTTLFHEFVTHALRLHPEVNWIVFAGPGQPWEILDARVQVVRGFPANDRRAARLRADHFRVAPAAKARGAAALLTVGFVPLRTAGLPVVMHVFSLHHLRPGGGLGAIYRRWAVARGLERAALVIANSQWTASQLGKVPAPVLVSHEGVQRERFTPTEPAGVASIEGLPREYLLWSSNFYAYKRVELALAAYASLGAALRARFPFVLIGGDWEGGRARAADAARSLGIERDTRFLGWVDDAALPALYRGARALVLSTREETFGRSVTEAMACGCPCVLQDLPVLREVTNGAALFTDFCDSTAASVALEKICSDDAVVRRLRTDGLHRAEAFSFEKLARERMAAILGALKSCP